MEQKRLRDLIDEKPALMKNLVRSLIVFAMLAGTASGETIIRSTGEQANLIELYTSEGCSSCPPADKWLSTLKSHPELWRTLIPVAFHVDYWDYIGWKDRYAQPAFTERQRQYAGENGMPTIYTPGLISNGEEWRNFSWQPPLTASLEGAGKLSGVVSSDQVAISYRPAQAVDTHQLTVNVALLGFGLVSEVRDGENRGRKLEHDFVVLDHLQVAMLFEDGIFRALTKLPQSGERADRYALTLWVSEDDKQAPIQAAGGWLSL